MFTYFSDENEKYFVSSLNESTTTKWYKILPTSYTLLSFDSCEDPWKETHECYKKKLPDCRHPDDVFIF